MICAEKLKWNNRVDEVCSVSVYKKKRRRPLFRAIVVKPLHLHTNRMK